MKKLAVLGLVLMMFMSVGYAAPTQTTVNWSGGGSAITVDTTFGDDAISNFSTYADGAFAGTFVTYDGDNNPHNYNVDNTKTFAKAFIAGEGHIAQAFERLDSNGPGEPGCNYGPAGQFSSDSVEIIDGWAEMSTGNQSNYASMKQDSYNTGNNFGLGTYTSNGFHLEAHSSSFVMNKTLSSDKDLMAADRAFSIGATGAGSAQLYSLASELNDPQYKPEGLNFGIGCGHNHSNFKPRFIADGVGTYTLKAKGTNLIVIGKQSPGDTAWHTKVSESGGILPTLVDTEAYTGKLEKYDLGDRKSVV